MTFKREISIDGVAVILAAVAVIAFMVTVKVRQEDQGNTIREHADQLSRISQTQASLSQAIEVLTAIVNERTGTRSAALLTPRQKDSGN